MISTGNDIVALNTINPERTKQVDFYSKILSFSESELYCNKAFAEMPFENFVWLLWSIKESVYKYLKRSIPDLVFSPGKTIIQSIDFPKSYIVTKFGNNQNENSSFCEEEFYNCTVCFGNDIYYSRSKIHLDLIHTVVDNSDKFENIWWGIKYIDHDDYENQSKAVRSFILKKLNSIFPNDDFTIKKSAAGYPLLLREAKEINVPVSFTHHGHFVGYSFVLGGLCGGNRQ